MKYQNIFLIRGLTEKCVLREAVRDVITDTVYRRQKHPFLSPPATLNPDQRFSNYVHDMLRGSGLAAPGDKFIQPEFICLGASPCEIKAPRALFPRADAVFPVVAGDEIAAGVTHDWHVELADKLENVATETVGVGGRVAGFVNAAVDATSEMLNKTAEEARIYGADGVSLVQCYVCCGFHGAVN